MKLRQKIEGMGDLGPHRHALFYNFPGGLRFELTEGGGRLDEGLTALRKAWAICDTVFEQMEVNALASL